MVEPLAPWLSALAGQWSYGGPGSNDNGRAKGLWLSANA